MQVTFFLAAVVLGGEREAGSRNAYIPCVVYQARVVPAANPRPRPHAKLAPQLSTASARFAETWMCRWALLHPFRDGA